MSRPRDVWIGSDTTIRAKNFRNKKTGAVITDAVGTVNIYNDVTNALIFTANWTNNGDGSYEVVVPWDQGNLTEGLRLRCELYLNGGTNQKVTISVKAIARKKKDDGL